MRNKLKSIVILSAIWAVTPAYAYDGEIELPEGTGYNVQEDVIYSSNVERERLLKPPSLPVNTEVNLPTIVDEAVKATPKAEPDLWVLRPGRLKSQLSEWSKKAGQDQQLVWKGKEDTIIDVNAVFKGTYRESVEVLANSLSDNGIRIYFDLYLGNDVLVVEVSK